MSDFVTIPRNPTNEMLQTLMNSIMGDRASLTRLDEAASNAWDAVIRAAEKVKPADSDIKEIKYGIYPNWFILHIKNNRIVEFEAHTPYSGSWISRPDPRLTWNQTFIRHARNRLGASEEDLKEFLIDENILGE